MVKAQGPLHLYFGWPSLAFWLCWPCSASWNHFYPCFFPLLPLWVFFPSLFCGLFAILSLQSFCLQPNHTLLVRFSHSPSLSRTVVRSSRSWVSTWGPNHGSTHHSLSHHGKATQTLVVSFLFCESGPPDRIVVEFNETMLAKHLKQCRAHSKHSLINGGYHCVFRASTLPCAHINHGTFLLCIVLFQTSH